MSLEIKARAQFTPRGDLGQFIAVKLTPAAISATNAAAQIILAHAQDIVPVRSGDLRASGHVVEASADGKTAVAQVVFDAPYAAYVEFGTGRRGEASAMAGAGPYSQSWPGMEPRPYLRPALDSSRQEVNAAMANTLSLSLRS